VLRVTEFKAEAQCILEGRPGWGGGPNSDFRAGPNGLPTFCEKSKGMALLLQVRYDKARRRGE